jgi:hypothetical protein
MPETLDNDQINRLWAHRLQVVDIFYNRLNFFLVFESVLMGVVGVLYSRPIPPLFLLRVIIILGLSLTVIWGYAQARQKYIIEDLRAKMREVAPEYKATLERRNKVTWPIPSMWLLTYLVPALVAIVWIVFLFYL